MTQHPRSASISFSQSLLASFRNLFEHQNSRQDIVDVIATLEAGRPIAHLVQSPHGSFSTIFLPFHSGSEEFKTAMKSGAVHPQLAQFCTVCGKIEGLTDTMGITGEEPPADDKKQLLPLLKEFLATLPSAEEFKTWLQ